MIPQPKNNRVALDFRQLAQRARRGERFPVDSLDGMAALLGSIERKRQQGRRVRRADARVALLYAADFLALVGLHLPVAEDAKVFAPIMAAIDAATGVEVRP